MTRRTPPDTSGMKMQRFGNHGNLAVWLKLMLAGPRTLREMAAKTGMHYETLRPLVKLLHAEGVVHVESWRLDDAGRQTIAVYALGIGVDAPKRKPMTNAQRSLAYKRRKEAEAEEADVLAPAGKLGAATRHLAAGLWQ